MSLVFVYIQLTLLATCTANGVWKRNGGADSFKSSQRDDSIRRECLLRGANAATATPTRDPPVWESAVPTTTILISSISIQQLLEPETVSMGICSPIRISTIIFFSFMLQHQLEPQTSCIGPHSPNH